MFSKAFSFNVRKDNSPIVMERRTRQEFSEKLTSKDGIVFREYVQNTTAHGVVRIFNKNYNILRRLFWLVVFLTSAALCMNNCIERIRLLASRPTSTSTTTIRKMPLEFPAVTICNLNYFTDSGLEQAGILDVGPEALNLDPLDPGDVDQCKASLSSHPVASKIFLEDLNGNATQPLSKFVLNCTYLGRSCDLEHDFQSSSFGIGTCYTFNGVGRNESLTTYGTGSRQGLFMVLNINQLEYTGSELLDAGVRISVEPTFEPSQVLDQGISVPTGRFAFIGTRQEQYINRAGRDCISGKRTDRLNFLHNLYNYSESACLLDCLFTAIADRCSCFTKTGTLPSSNPRYANIRNCTFADVCCVQVVRSSALNCTCPPSCTTTLYDQSVSYSSFPAEYISEIFLNSTTETLDRDLVGLSVYFRTPNVHTEITSVSYTPVALLSDIGGQLGLFLGISVISVLELGTWLLDECLHRFCCFSWKKQKARENQSDPEEGFA